MPSSWKFNGVVMAVAQKQLILNCFSKDIVQLPSDFISCRDASHDCHLTYDPPDRWAGGRVRLCINVGTAQVHNELLETAGQPGGN